MERIIDNLIDAVKSSPSWRVRLSVLPVLQVFYFRNLLNLSDASVKSVLDVLLQCLRDENVEVRETAAKTLSGVIRCSQRERILPLKVGSLEPAAISFADFSRLDSLHKARSEDQAPETTGERGLLRSDQDPSLRRPRALCSPRCISLLCGTLGPRDHRESVEVFVRPSSNIDEHSEVRCQLQANSPGRHSDSEVSYC